MPLPILKNELINESSVYLQQHAHNPVHWQAWNENTLALAKKLNKPILLSIGYAACHWCHVMEKESFENEATAALMNQYFVNIKVDREERPDIDHIYMDAVQAITGSGGWPLNVFLTPDAKPFYGGTYFPPVKLHGRASWIDVLENINNNWINNRVKMELQADTLLAHLAKANNFSKLNIESDINLGNQIFTADECKSIAKNLLNKADTIHGGFGTAPKFPQTFSINCLLQAAYFYDDKAALNHAELSLTKLYQSGTYDQLAGGLCRYSTDNEWLAPHFEKMLYDNALFLIALSNAYLLTKKHIYAQAIQHVFKFLLTEMKATEGGFYSAIDADSEGEEGKFYTWSKAEFDDVLGEDASILAQYFDVTEKGNWEGKNILRLVTSKENIAAINKISLAELDNKIEASINKLLQKRNKRIRPTTDDKIILSWNALLITAFCKAFAVTGNIQYKIEAQNLFEFISNNMKNGETQLYHTHQRGSAKGAAFLDDYAMLIEASINLQEITSNSNYLHFAKTLTISVFNDFKDESGPFFCFTKINQADVILRKIELYDGAFPSANATMAKNLIYLSKIFGSPEWYSNAVSMIVSIKSVLLQHPNSFGCWAYEAVNISNVINEISVVGNNMTTLLHEVLHEYIPNKVLQSSSEDSNMILLSKKYVFQKTLLYLCLNMECRKPYEKTNDLLFAIRNKV
jgi:uncharacterized protein